MSRALQNITASARRAQAADGTILTSEFLESCRELLPIVGMVLLLRLLTGGMVQYPHRAGRLRTFYLTGMVCLQTSLA